MSLRQDDQEVKGFTFVCNMVPKNEQNPTQDWTRLLKAVAWYQKLGDSLLALDAKRKELATNVCTRSRHQKLASQLHIFRSTLSGQLLSMKDLGRAEKEIVSCNQRQAFPNEFEKLKMTPQCSKKSTLYKLDPVIKDGLLRVGGRLSRATMSESMKHSIILPKHSHTSNLLLRHIHERYGHCGRNYILAQLRKKYWIISGNTAARKIISKCVTCRRLKGKTEEQKMANLPEERTQPDIPPFTNVGMDYFGPIETKRGRNFVKRYGVLFTCMSLLWEFQIFLNFLISD